MTEQLPPVIGLRRPKALVCLAATERGPCRNARFLVFHRGGRPLLQCVRCRATYELDEQE